MKKSFLFCASAILSISLLTGCNGTGNRSTIDPPASPAAEAQATATNGANAGAPAVKDALAFAEVYKLKEYTVAYSENLLDEEVLQKRIEEMNGFFTERFAQHAENIRYTGLPLAVSYTQKASLIPEKPIFKVSADKGSILELDYSVELILHHETKPNETVSVKGLLTLSSENDSWLVQGDRFDSGLAELAQKPDFQAGLDVDFQSAAALLTEDELPLLDVLEQNLTALVKHDYEAFKAGFVNEELADTLGFYYGEHLQYKFSEMESVERYNDLFHQVHIIVAGECLNTATGQIDDVKMMYAIRQSDQGEWDIYTID